MVCMCTVEVPVAESLQYKLLIPLEISQIWLIIHEAYIRVIMYNICETGLPVLHFRPVVAWLRSSPDVEGVEVGGEGVEGVEGEAPLQRGALRDLVGLVRDGLEEQVLNVPPRLQVAFQGQRSE